MVKSSATVTRCRPIVPGLVFSEDGLEPDKYASNVDIEICRNCNYQCSYCYLERIETDVKPEKRKLIHVVDEVAAIKPKNVLFTGGEVLLRKDFFDLVEYATKERDLQVSIFTNGYLIDEITAAKLSYFNVNVCLKVDSLEPSIQDRLTGFPGSGVAIEKAVSNLKKHGYCAYKSLSIHACITRLNSKGLKQLFQWAKSKHIVPHASRLVPWGNGKVNYAELGLTASELRETFLELRGDDLIPFPSQVGCVKMYKSCFINALGEVQPCSNVLISAGNVHKQDLRHLLQTPVFKTARNIRKEIKGSCAICENNRICYGCRGLAHAITGDWLAEDPLCWHVRVERGTGTIARRE